MTFLESSSIAIWPKTTGFLRHGEENGYRIDQEDSKRILPAISFGPAIPGRVLLIPKGRDYFRFAVTL
jgi:hypothetical protein